MIIRELEHQSILEYEGKILMEAVKYLIPSFIFESGTNNGYSTGWLLAGIKDVIKEKGMHSTLISCDPRREPDSVNLLGMEKGSCFAFYKEKSEIVLERYLNGNYVDRTHFDFCFLDGDHRNFMVYKELELLKIGERNCPIVFLHDVRLNAQIEDKDPFRALVQYIEEKCNREYSIFNLIPPTSLATNLHEYAIKKIIENCEFNFACEPISLDKVIKKDG